MKFVNTAILTILSGIVIGIAVSGLFRVSLQTILVLCLFLITTLSVHYFLSLKNIKLKRLFTFHTFLASFFIGILVAEVHNPTLKSNHYTNLLKENEFYLLQIRILERVSESDFGFTYKAKLVSADNEQVGGKLLVFFPKNSSERIDFQRDDFLTLSAKLTSISAPKNPYQFDYKSYMQRQDVFYRANVFSYKVHNELKESSIRGFAEKIRIKMFSVLDSNFSKETASLLKTLLLGERKELDENTYKNYIDAGAVHILAISGLHVGIITAMLLFLLQKLPNFGIWKKLRFVLLLFFLWSFAFLAGLSPSVLRAVTMFSFIGVALMLNRQQGRFDALMFSMLLLLLINPNYLYEVGFQLSYLAVFSILMFYPHLEKLWKPKIRILKGIWSLFLVGISAQIVILPISLYYFHQFPFLFFISNLLLVPLLSPILVLGFLALILGSFNVLPSFLSFILEKIIYLMNFFTKIIASQEEFIVRNIYFDNKLLIVSLLIVFTLIFWVNKRNFKSIIALLSSILLFQGVLFYNKYKIENTENLTIFHLHRKSLFSVRNGKQLFVFQNDSVKSNRIIDNYVTSSGVSNVSIQKIPHVIQYQGNVILCLDSLAIYPKSKKIKVDKIIVTQSPKINFERMLLEIKPKIVIADGRNFPNTIKQLQTKCNELGVLFHATLEEGAYVE
ncbi:ComEC/Rec2 family competence protein [Capnocytophaga cynodegmi]|uniref:ComEC/Rec2 family competence protein n=1 Tax=Capnocytophaga cynodegmi TaxID=28189 RepID=UPI001AD19A42|nr:ComEC/Rec2 family competence protein [Capnocytophaga cynodegmi]GIM53949.1 competence protein ComEC [Capnocytophaga cynodegmi]